MVDKLNSFLRTALLLILVIVIGWWTLFLRGQLTEHERDLEGRDAEISTLSQAGIVSGSPGPGGGYALAKGPDEITLRDVWSLFERPDSSRVAFVGSEICGISAPGDLSNRIGRVEQAMNSLLDETTFDVFCGKAKEDPSEDLGPNVLEDRQAS